VSDISGWYGFFESQAHAGVDVRKERRTLTEEHGRIVNRKFIDESRVEILLNDIGSST
jgi:hypothetical protein